MLQRPAISLKLSDIRLKQKGLDQAEQICTLCVHMFSCLHSTVQKPGASLASGFSTNYRRAFSLKTERQNEKKYGRF